MFREMRRRKQQLSESECSAILARGTSGVLALRGDEGYPYAVPLSYVYDDRKIYFHSAKAGHKIDAIRSCSKASFCVIDQDEVVPEEYTTYFKATPHKDRPTAFVRCCLKSVIAFGKIRFLEDPDEKRGAIEKLGRVHISVHTRFLGGFPPSSALKILEVRKVRLQIFALNLSKIRSKIRIFSLCEHALAIKYYPANNQTNRDRSIDKEWNPLCTFVLSVEYMTGKAAIEIVPEGM